MLPRVGGIIPARQRSVVVLPAPLGPTSPITSPGCTSKSSSFTATNSPYSFVSASTWIIQRGPSGKGRGSQSAGYARSAVRNLRRRLRRSSPGSLTAPSQGVKRGAEHWRHECLTQRQVARATSAPPICEAVPSPHPTVAAVASQHAQGLKGCETDVERICNRFGTALQPNCNGPSYE